MTTQQKREFLLALINYVETNINRVTYLCKYPSITEEQKTYLETIRPIEGPYVNPAFNQVEDPWWWYWDNLPNVINEEKIKFLKQQILGL